MNEQPIAMPRLSTDHLFAGRLCVQQPVTGYRVSMDAPLLTWFAHNGKRARHCLDLCAGSGVIGLGLVVAGAAHRLTAVEVQPHLADLCRRNAAANGIADKTTTLCADVTQPIAALPTHGFDLVVANPPYWEAHAGRLPEDAARRIAKHEVKLTLPELMRTAKRALHPRKGRFCLAYPAQRIQHLMTCAQQAGLHLHRLVLVHPAPHQPAQLVLTELRPGPKGHAQVEPALILCDADGAQTPQAAAIFSGAFFTTDGPPHPAVGKEPVADTS